MNKIRIVGAVASKSGITLYLEDGQQKELAKNSHRTNEIMQSIAKPLAKKKVVEIDLDTYSAHAQIEKKTGGLIRFAIEKAKSFLGMKVETGGTFGSIAVKEDETLVAHVGDKKIPGVQALHNQIERAAFTKDCNGFKLFMERLAAVIDERGHSVQELLNFMKRADLPIADDGTIIAYKTLRYLDRNDKTVFVDCHSRTVQQKLGSRVSMPMEKVDPSRRTQCSTGLHIARRQYLSWFNGDLITLVKVAPEDVIAVPHGEPDKMRAMAYHIVYVLPGEIGALIRNNTAMTSNKDAAKILADIIAGDHVGVLEEVRIGEKKEGAASDYDKKIEVEKIEDAKPFLGAGDNGMASALDDEEAVEVDIKALNKQVEEVQAEREAEPKRIAKPKAAQKPKKDGDPGDWIDGEKDEAPKPVDPAPKEVTQMTDAQKRREEAYQAVVNGMSQREAAKQFKVCAKTLRKMVRDRAPKAAE
ncbi:helix-turn-helix domain-containing protein [Phaeobacter gallaeciensis]|uniref:helix-turn-helix domain-containing protein n=1 Tax=Phaeobacter gallaeciensis TaxID=60890 RepID=UPI00238098B7|nr:helix-turn-helix domain-containing protein [Phaeobacter gallaeciensis]MDE4297174.1 helix-turn-helix domain-containing protein [Phaeobacter gallaeciensis]